MMSLGSGIYDCMCCKGYNCVEPMKTGVIFLKVNFLVKCIEDGICSYKDFIDSRKKFHFMGD